MIKDDIAPDVVAAIEDIVRREVGRFGLLDVRVALAEDDDGDPVLEIDADYEAAGDPVDPQVVAGLLSKLRDRLWTMNERRFPYIRHHFSEQQKVIAIS